MKATLMIGDRRGKDMAAPGHFNMRWAVFALVATAALATGGDNLRAERASAPGAGTLEIRFFFSTPTTVEPTYHSAIWLEDKNGHIVKTLYVSQELSDMAYKMGNACPDWVKQAKWESVPKSEVAAVTAPTPNVGNGELDFDLAKLGISPGVYGFRFQVHVSEEYNVLHRGQLTVGDQSSAVKLETVSGPGKLATSEQFVRDVQVRYVAPRK
jgi:hypothetical protein